MHHQARVKPRSRTVLGLVIAISVLLGILAAATPAQSYEYEDGGVLVTLHATPYNVTAGGTVTLYGKRYSPSGSNISIRLGGPGGRVIGTFPPPDWEGAAIRNCSRARRCWGSGSGGGGVWW